VPERRAVGGDVVADELPEERPAGRDRPVGVLAVDAQVRRPAGPAQRVQNPFVGLERRQVLEQPPVASPLNRRVDALGRQAVIAGDRRDAHE
jgi:hypothetical protein